MLSGTETLLPLLLGVWLLAPAATAAPLIVQAPAEESESPRAFVETVQYRRPAHRPGIAVRPPRPGLAIVRPGRPVVVVRPWRKRPHFGRIVAGVALGSIIAVAVAGAISRAPSPNLCWYWTDRSEVECYWDYCRSRIWLRGSHKCAVRSNGG